MIRYIVIFMISFLISSCQKNGKESSAKILSFIHTESTYLKTIASKIEVIELPRTDNSYMSGYKRLLVKDGLWIFEDKKGVIFVFDDNGKFISNSLGKIGNGSNEYSIILAYTYNCFTKEIEIVTPGGIKKYDIKFNYKGYVDFLHEETKTLMFNYIYDISKHEHLLLSPINQENGCSNVYIYNSEKQEIVNIIPYNAECPYITMQEQCVSDGNFLALPSMNYSFYQINTNDYVLEKKITFDFGNDNLHEDDYVNKGDVRAIKTYLATDCDKSLPLRTFKDDNRLLSLVKVGPKRSDIRTYIVNLETGESKYVPYNDGNIKLPLAEAFVGNVMYACVSEDELLESIDESLLDSKSKSVVEKRCVESNYYIIKYHIK